MKPAKRMGLLVLGLIYCGLGYAQQPRVTNAQVTDRSAAGGLEREFRALVSGQATPAWIGYAVSAVAGEHWMCCGDGCCGGCRLEGNSPGRGRSTENSPVKLEESGSLLVLFRVEHGQVQKIRTFSEDCELDAGGLPFYRLTSVNPQESITLLASYAKSGNGDRQSEHKLSDAAVAAIAFHKDALADSMLEQFTAAAQPEALRERTSFWLGAARGRRGYEILRRMVKEDPSDRVREKVIFALSVSKEPDALSTMIETARGDASAHVRSQAIFWLSQKAGKKAEDAITDAIENDPETEVKKKAVFALSQLPKDEGVPKLIQVAKSNRNPAVRKQAIFWLGQSQDPRALAFFEQILK
ncbi:MAG TPA: HEAT repeat domain-containing protein [Acidobacteriota bacterium]|nr:HEAT repeat domain-containing protein [Acidobacteriota bacterium]